MSWDLAAQPSTHRTHNAFKARLCVTPKTALTTELPETSFPKTACNRNLEFQGIGRDGWGKNSGLKFRMITKMAQSRGWRAVLLTDCFGQEPGTIKLRGPGGHWILIFGLRTGILLLLGAWWVGSIQFSGGTFLWGSGSMCWSRC